MAPYCNRSHIRSMPNPDSFGLIKIHKRHKLTRVRVWYAFIRFRHPLLMYMVWVHENNEADVKTDDGDLNSKPSVEFATFSASKSVDALWLSDVSSHRSESSVEFRRQAITWNSSDLLAFGPFGTILSKIWIKTKIVYWRKYISNVCCKMSAHDDVIK